MRPLLSLTPPPNSAFATTKVGLPQATVVTAVVDAVVAAVVTFTTALLLVIALALLQPAQGQTLARTPAGTPTSLPTIDLYVGMHRLKTEVAINPPDRATGLMWRQSMPDNQGMLFVFEGYALHCFWMRNTFIPLSIAFLRDDGSIVNIEDMQPQQDTSHCPKEPVRFALEVNQGWFATRNIESSMTVRGLPGTAK